MKCGSHKFYIKMVKNKSVWQKIYTFFNFYILTSIEKDGKYYRILYWKNIKLLMLPKAVVSPQSLFRNKLKQNSN